MSHRFFEGEVYHKRFRPHSHEFTYPFFILDMNLSHLSSLKSKLFSFNGLNLFSFKVKDHFGRHHDFKENVHELLDKFGLQGSESMRFLTLPRMFNYVFNPISVLVLMSQDKPSHILVEVHNYNGGNIVYPVVLVEKKEGVYEGEVDKDMYVSPFFERTGRYRFLLQYTPKRLTLQVTLYEQDQKKLIARFTGESLAFSNKVMVHLLARQSFLTIKVVTRTLWQSLCLWKKGLTWYSPAKIDQMRRY